MRGAGPVRTAAGGRARPAHLAEDIFPRFDVRVNLWRSFGQNSCEKCAPKSDAQAGEPIVVSCNSKTEYVSSSITSRMPKGIPNPAAMYGIYSRSWGFEVSIVRNGIRHHRLFGKASYGGSEQALLHAQDWRDHIVRSVPPQTRSARAEKPRANNSTGVTGVFHHLAPGGRVRAWMAKTYIAQDEILRTDFSVAELGDDAQALAIQERAQQLKRMTGLARIHPAEEAIRMGLSAHAAGPRTAKRSKSEITRRNNTSGVSGVHFKTPNPSHPGYWLAITYTAGKGSVSKAFSVKTFGAEVARNMAIAERASQLADKQRGADEEETTTRGKTRAAEPALQRKPRARTASGTGRNNG